MNAETTTDEVLEGVDLTGTTAVVTGASTGLGRETARALASAGADVVLAVRDETRGAAAADAIRDGVGPDPRLEVEVVDLASLASVRAFAARVLAAHPEIDFLVNNAGVMYTPLERTADGFELQFGTNHVAHFLLTNLLVPALVAGAPTRVVNVSSQGHIGSDIVWDDPNYEHRPYDKFDAYAQSKTANILFTVELDRRLRDRGVRSFAVHPGLVGTELGRHMTRDDFAELKARASQGPSGKWPTAKSIEAGAATTVWAATAAELEGRGGLYFADCQIATAESWATEAGSAERLWTLTEQLVGESFDA